MKTRNDANKTPIILGTFLIAALWMNSCIAPDYFPCVRPEGPIVEEARTGPDFDGLDLRLHAQAFVTTGPEPGILIEASANLLPFIRTRVSGGKLIIDQDRCIRCRLDDITLYVTVPSLHHVSLSGSGTITVQDPMLAQELSFDVSGSGQLSAMVNSRYVSSRISGSGNILLTGETDSQKGVITGSGSLDALDLACRDAEIRISGSGSTWLKASRHLDARITGSGQVFYLGDPAVSASITGTGTIHRLP
jgi:hypothetical protein